MATADKSAQEEATRPSLMRQSSDTWGWPLQHADETEKRGQTKQQKLEEGTVHVKDQRHSWKVDLDAGNFRPDEIDVMFQAIN